MTALTLLVFAPSATAQTQTYSGGSPLSLSAAGAATPYPSTLDVAGLGGTISDVNVTLNGVTLTSSNLDLLLVDPHGDATLISSDVPTTGIISQNWTFDDGAASEQPTDALTGIFKPTDADPLGDSDALPAPATTEYGSTLAGFDNVTPNGTWELYAADSSALPVSIGSITGWSLTITTVTGLAESAPATKDFGSQLVSSTGAAQAFTITNAGDDVMQITSAEIQGADASSFVANTNSCINATLDVAATCTVEVAFRPVSGGAKSASLVLGDDTGGPGLAIPLSGSGLTPAITISPAAVDFGEVPLGTSIADQTVTFTNTGTAPAAAVSYGLNTADHSFAIGSESCTTLAIGQSCSVNLGFIPATLGTKRATFGVSTFAPATHSEIPVTGTLLARATQNPQPSDIGSSDVEVQSAGFSGPVVVGRPTTLHIEASDAKEAVTGLIVDFGEKLGRYGASGCVSGATKGTSAVFDIPYTFTKAGQHTVKATILAGGCGKAHARTRMVPVVVEPAKAARRIATSADTIAGPQITTKCKNASLMPSANKKKTKQLLTALLCVMNDQRKLAGLKPLKLSKKLGKAAVTHSRAMISGKFFAHQGPKEPGLPARLKKAKYRGAAGENIGAGAGPLASPVSVVNAWMHSTPHRANLLSRQWKTVGIGFVAAFPLSTTRPAGTFTTDFGVKP